MFTKKHYIELAEIVRSMLDMACSTSDMGLDEEASSQLDVAVMTAEKLIKIFKKDNDRFNEDLFRKACGVDNPHLRAH